MAVRRDLAEELRRLQDHPKNIRNICILAHVDHGKTTLADSLIASNGIISKRLAGKLRYMDNREDEQLRGITMKSSAIALQFDEGTDKYLINLIDSPGHVDFSSEVSTAVRLCDGALVVIDVVEGVCPQTKIVLEQAWQEGIKPCLVLNKIDRLITNLKYSPIEAYYHIQDVLGQVNAVTATLWTTEILQQQSASANNHTHSNDKDAEDIIYDWSTGLSEKDDSTVYFSPEQGNVVFTSAIDGWGFRIEHFASMYAKKLGIREDVLRKTLWGDYYLDKKTKRIYKGAYNKGKKPLFVQFVLENLWTVYDAVRGRKKDKAMIDKITNSLGLKISDRDARHSDSSVHLHSICSQWLPLADAILNMVINQLPSPLELTRERVQKLMCSNTKMFESFPSCTQALVEDFLLCKSGSSLPVVLFISKMFHVDPLALPENRTQTLSAEEMKEKRETIIKNLQSENKFEVTNTDEISDDNPETTPTDHASSFLAFARVYSGTIHKGQTLFILHPRYDPSDINDQSILSTSPEDLSSLPPNTDKFIVKSLYLLMGRDVMEVESVPPGNILAIGGLSEIVVKSATVSNTLACPAFCSLNFAASPIVHVAIEPIHFSDMPALVQGMKLLNQADPCVKLTVQETGEHVLSTAGEVHLQRCLDDLRNTFAKVEFKVSPPIIPFRETIIPPPKIDMVNEIISTENEVKFITKPHLVKDSDDCTTPPTNNKGLVTVYTPNKSCRLQLLVRPLPSNVVKLLESNTHILKALNLLNNGETSISEFNEDILLKIRQLRADLEQAFSEDDNWSDVIDHIWAFGPRNTGPNILLNGIEDYPRPSLWAVLDPHLSESQRVHQVIRDYDNSIVSGFQLATLAGPLCEEPMYGVCLVLIDWTITTPTSFVEGGSLISVMKEGCRQAFLAQPSRLMAAMYTCNIQAVSAVLGYVYAVIGGRGGRVISDDMIEGSDQFNIQALIPVAESFGFCDEFRKQTIGQANPQLFFSHWEIIPSDPFWVPSTEEELLHYGEKADSESLARVYMNSVRKRKGLPVDEKIVEHAEKQRTLKKNK